MSRSSSKALFAVTTCVALASSTSLARAQESAAKKDGPHFHVDAGVAKRSLYEIPFWGGELRLGAGGSLGGLRILGTFGVLYAKDDTELRMTQMMFGALFEGNIVGPVFLGGGFDVGGASVRLRSRSPVAIGAGFNAHIGVDLTRFENGGAFFLQLRGAIHAFDGRDARGPESVGGTLGVGFRL
jgi:hypothetical protein